MKRIISLVLAAVMLLGVCAMAEPSEKEIIKSVQQALNDAGYNCGTPDGAYGKKTKNAITQYQNDRGMITTGMITEELLISLGLMSGFDYKAFSELESFKEDKFDKAWSVSSSARQGDLVCNASIHGNTDGSINTFALNVYMLEEGEEKKAIWPDEIQFLLDDGRVHTFNMKGMNDAFNVSSIYFNPSMAEFIAALYNSETVDIRLQDYEVKGAGLASTVIGEASFTKAEFEPAALLLAAALEQGIFNYLSNDAKMTNSVWESMGYMRYEVK